MKTSLVSFFILFVISALYEAPCYYFPNRAGSFVVTVELRCGAETSDHWIQRGVALLMSLAT